MTAGRIAERRFTELGLTSLAPAGPLARYVPAVIVDRLVFTSGHGPLDADGTPVVAGLLGEDVDISAGVAASRLAATNLVASLRAALGSLDRVSRVVQVHGYVRCVAGFADLDGVMAGSRGVVLDIFGPEVGAHTPRVAAVSECVRGLAVTVDAVFAID